MTQEDKYRHQAAIFLRRITEARQLFNKHKPSIGFVGEYALRKSLHALMPKSYGICQGFVTYKGEISRQCDIIIYKKKNKSITKSYGELKIVNAESVVSVIEVKSSITKETFCSTLKAFEQLYALRVTNCFLFVYGKLTRRKLSNWFSAYKYPHSCTKQYIFTDSYLYDWPVIEWFPHSVLALESNKFFKLGHISADDGDWVGYTALNLKDSKDTCLSCIQECFSDIVMTICDSTISMEVEKFSIEDGIKLFRF